MPDVSKNSSAKYKKDFEEWDRNWERIFGNKNNEEINEEICQQNDKLEQ